MDVYRSFNGLMMVDCCVYLFFFKQKTAYEMRISDWSSDVCSSDLHDGVGAPADRPDHLVDLGRDVAGDRAVADIGVNLDEEITADRHRLALGVVDVAGDDRAAPRNLVADKLRSDIIGAAGAPAFPSALIFGNAVRKRVGSGKGISGRV